MNSDTHSKVTSQHLKRKAYLYVRQSTMRQVIENTESTQRQYALRTRAVALGWPIDQLVVIDHDLGHSAASAADRAGFQTLVAEVGLGRAGIVMGLEVSRLARNNADWHRLLEICALTDTLILDEDGIYDPAHFNDRLLLGLKGAMSEAELHLLRARLRGGMLNKARRGELKTPLPAGFVHDEQDKVVLDPDSQVRQAVGLFFQTFRRTGAATATAKSFRKDGLLFPRRLRCGASKGELVWEALHVNRALAMLRNPRYAGAYAFGRTHQRQTHEKRRVLERLPRERWHALLQDAHEGYISWPQYEENQTRLRDNAVAVGAAHPSCPPREGPALLQGVVLCGLCGRGMTVRYHAVAGRLVPEYLCVGRGNKHAAPSCQTIPGAGIDRAIGRLLVDALTPVTLDIALAVQQELQTRIDEAGAVRRKQVERARYETELARRRYMRIDPDNRLVADELEAEWNTKLRALAETQQDYERRSEADRKILDEQARARILALATDFPKLWNDPHTPDRERKRMVRILLEDVTLIKAQDITLQVRFRGGATRTLRIPKQLNGFQQRKLPPDTVAEIDRLLEHHTDGEIAALLNARGFLSGEGKPLDGHRIAYVRRAYKLKSRYERLRAAGWLTLKEAAVALEISTWTVKLRRAAGRVTGQRVDDMGRCLYDPRLAERLRGPPGRRVPSTRSKEVQCDA